MDDLFSTSSPTQGSCASPRTGPIVGKGASVALHLTLLFAAVVLPQAMSSRDAMQSPRPAASKVIFFVAPPPGSINRRPVTAREPLVEESVPRVQTAVLSSPTHAPTESTPERVKTGVLMRADASRSDASPGRIEAVGFGAPQSGGQGFRGSGPATLGSFPSVGGSGTSPEGGTPGVERRPELLEEPVPVYTDDALRLRVTGRVVLQVELTAQGTVRVLHVVSGLGYGLDESAIAAVTRIRFRPAMTAGRPVTVVTRISVVFTLA